MFLPLDRTQASGCYSLPYKTTVADVVSFADRKNFFGTGLFSPPAPFCIDDAVVLLN